MSSGASIRRTLVGLLAVTALSAAFAALTVAAPSAGMNYRFYCAQCHGLTGRGDGPNATRHQPVSPRNFTSWSEMSILTDAEIILAIKHGGAATAKSRLMPPFSATLSAVEVVELKGYIRALCRCSGPESP